jgi:hypothetical protein
MGEKKQTHNSDLFGLAPPSLNSSLDLYNAFEETVKIKFPDLNFYEVKMGEYIPQE